MAASLARHTRAASASGRRHTDGLRVEAVQVERGAASLRLRVAYLCHTSQPAASVEATASGASALAR
jgi:hypothetical protein